MALEPPQAPKWHTREDSGFVIDRNVDWWHDGERIEHPNIVEAFNKGLRITDDGRYKLEFGNDWCFVKVQGAAFKVVAIDVAQDSKDEHVVSLRLSDRTTEWLDLASLQLDDEGVLVTSVKQGRAIARFNRETHFELAQLLEPDATGKTLQLRIGERVWPTSVLVKL